MKNILFFILIFATGCYSETDPASDSAEPQIPKQAPEQTEVSLGLTFDDIGSLDQSMIDEMAFDRFPGDFEPPVVDTSQIIKPLNWLSLEETEPYSNDRMVLQELNVLLNCDQLKIKYLGAFGKRLKYHVQCQNIIYLVEYDLKAVHIMKVIK